MQTGNRNHSHFTTPRYIQNKLDTMECFVLSVLRLTYILYRIDLFLSHSFPHSVTVPPACSPFGIRPLNRVLGWHLYTSIDNASTNTWENIRGPVEALCVWRWWKNCVEGDFLLMADFYMSWPVSTPSILKWLPFRLKTFPTSVRYHMYSNRSRLTLIVGYKQINSST